MIFRKRNLLTVLFFCFARSLEVGIDHTRNAGASGIAVTYAVIAQIQESCIFSIDYLFLRRMALSASNYGTSSASSGGIWQISQESFELSKDYNIIYNKLYPEIKDHFDIDWLKVIWDDLRKPLFSGIAAMLILEKFAPIPKDVNEQAVFYQEHFSGDQSLFLAKSKMSINVGCESENLDMAFVLDASGSVGGYHYKESKNFTAEVVKNFDTGYDKVRVAVMSFSSYVHEEIYLNNSFSKADLTNVIRDIDYENGGTNTADALKALRTSMFTHNKGSRPYSAKIAIIQTDGSSNCFSCTIDEAEKLKDEGVTIFSIGIGGASMRELEGMASKPVCTHVRVLKDFKELDSIISDIKESACTTEVIQSTNASNTYRCKGKTTIRIDPEDEYSIITRPEVKRLNIFGSFQTTHPNSAFADFISESSDNKPTVFYVYNATKSISISIESFHDGADCDSTFLVKTLPSNELRKTAASNLCFNSGKLTTCSDMDFIMREDYETSILNSTDSLISMCSASRGYQAHPETNTKFIYCVNESSAIEVQCPPHFGYHPALQDCNTPASTEPGEMCKVCNAKDYEMGFRRFPLTSSNEKFVSCLGIGECSIDTCATGDFIPFKQMCLQSEASGGNVSKLSMIPIIFWAFAIFFASFINSSHCFV